MPVAGVKLSFEWNEMTVIGINFHTYIIANIVDPSSHHRNDMNFMPIGNLNKVTDVVDIATKVRRESRLLPRS